MKRFLLIFMLICLTTGCSNTLTSFNAVIEGDIDKLTLTSLSGYKLHDFEYKDQKYQGIKLDEIVNIDDDYRILVMSNDGAMAVIAGDMTNSYLYVDQENGLCITNVMHPVNGNIKDIYRIVVENSDDGKTLMIDDGDIRQYSMVDFYIDQPNISIKDGASTQNDNHTEVYVKRVTMNLKADDPYVIFTSDGQQLYDYDGYIQIIDNQFVYVSSSGQRLFDVVGVLYDAPLSSIRDTYDLVIDYIDKNKVMVIEVDGLGYHMLGDTSLPLKRALSVYPSISNVALASILSGQLPSVTEINERKDRELTSMSVFDIAMSKNLKTIYIEGDSSLIKTSVDPVLNLDKNNLNGTDDEVYQTTLKAISDDYDFIFTHFHGVDDISHQYGPNSDETVAKWIEVQGYINQLVSHFDGIVIIVSDHGQHATSDGGNHGTTQSDDIVGVVGVIQN